jgi:MFS family permease
MNGKSFVWGQTSAWFARLASIECFYRAANSKNASRRSSDEENPVISDLHSADRKLHPVYCPPTMESLNPSGYTAVLKNRNFLALWLAQVLSNTALTGSFFLQLILIEQDTASSAHLGAVIIAFSLPAVLLSALAGMIVDRVPKKTILVASNGLRVLTGAALAILAAFLLTKRVNDALFLVAIYILVFVTSAIGQFFAPAEGSTIPLLVRSENLLPANSLFTMTFTASQILGMVILAPLGVKTIGIVPSLWIAVAMYLLATIFVVLLPHDRPVRVAAIDGVSTVRTAWIEIREGWQFALSQRGVFVALLQLSLVSAMTMILAMLAPGYAARVLGLQPEDAIYVFWPAGIGMLLASILVGRFGQRVPREMLASIGIVGMAMAMGGLAWVGSGTIVFRMPLFIGHPELMISTTMWVMIFSLLAGMMMASINIPAQTIVQERSSDELRGRVLAVQFTLANLVGIPPMLFLGNLADIFGIPSVTIAIALAIAMVALLNVAWAIAHFRSARTSPPISDTSVPR